MKDVAELCGEHAAACRDLYMHCNRVEAEGMAAIEHMLKGGALVSCVVGLPSSDAGCRRGRSRVASGPLLAFPRRRRPVAGVPAPPTAADGQSSALAARGSAAQGWASSRDAGCPALAQVGAADGRGGQLAVLSPRRFLKPWEHVRRRDCSRRPFEQ